MCPIVNVAECTQLPRSQVVVDGDPSVVLESSGE